MFGPELVGGLSEAMSDCHEFIHAFELLNYSFLFFIVIVNVRKAVKMFFVLLLLDLYSMQLEVFYHFL
jgi:hypothetical protein